jgi:hypothetical protein
VTIRTVKDLIFALSLCPPDAIVFRKDYEYGISEIFDPEIIEVVDTNKIWPRVPDVTKKTLKEADRGKESFVELDSIGRKLREAMIPADIIRAIII